MHYNVVKQELYPFEGLSITKLSLLEVLVKRFEQGKLVKKMAMDKYEFRQIEKLKNVGIINITEEAVNILQLFNSMHPEENKTEANVNEEKSESQCDNHEVTEDYVDETEEKNDSEYKMLEIHDTVPVMMDAYGNQYICRKDIIQVLEKNKIFML